MQYLLVIDSFLISCAERYVAHPIQRIFGLNPIGQCKICLVLMVIMIIFNLVFFLDPAGIFFILALAFTGTISDLFSGKLDKLMEYHQKNQLSNPTKIVPTLVVVRLLWPVGMSILIPSQIFIEHNWISPIIFTLIWLFFLLFSSDSLPPSASKVSEWLNAIKAYGKAAHATNASS